MKRIAGLAAVVLLVASACSDTPTAPGDKSGASPEPVGAAAKAAWLQAQGYEFKPGNFGDPKQYLSFPPPLWQPVFGTNLGLTDDSCAQVAFNFPFSFFGRQFTTAWIGSNGYVTFDNCFTQFVVAFPPGTRPIIAPWWTDWNPGAGGAVFFRVTGNAPSRRLIVTWAGVPEYGVGGSNTFQLQLLERLSVIVVSYNGGTFNGVHGGNASVVGFSNGIVGFGGFPGVYTFASGAQVPTFQGTTQCFIFLNGAYRNFSDFVCSIFAA